ncbi:DUF5082 family protein [Aciduricibacillus chroicocephali]|uniref:DUF5082 family protein n=1 Tax=Aciduricibacillus chroicocephali TaxID=3054939 RepID=A0ABY9KVB6_9BACI|nr:DUF5082 family protein [Bacillaceae bacterium 44XB]
MANLLVNMQMSTLNSAIDTISFSLQKKREELLRLQKALAELTEIKSEFIEYEHMTREPELTAANWHGKHANQFKQIQQSIQNDYHDLSDKQLNQTIRDIEAAIEKLKAEIAMLEASLSSARQALSSLKS